MRKKIDSRVRVLVENGVHSHHRSFFVVVGDRGREQVVNLHYMLSKAVVKSRPSVLWCYKKELGFSSNKQKRQRQMKKKVRRGAEAAEEDPFELFVSATQIRYCYYKDTGSILGGTFGMLVLQDFEALTPNLLARTIETVEGGGLVVLLLKTMSSLRQLYSTAMDAHANMRTAAHQHITARFAERFLLSLASCRSCLVVDDELNVLPVSSHARALAPLGAGQPESVAARELRELKGEMAGHQPMGALTAVARTLDQARALLSFMDAVAEKSLRTTVTLTAGRGRGKSAALGLAVAAAVAMGYSNVFVTSPSPENLRTFFEFVCKGFDAVDMKEHTHYELVESVVPEFHGAVVRINVFRQHRQTVQYIQPHDYQKLGQAELLVIDEAAAIPLPYVQRLLGPYLVFLASTVNGYEGTGRSLSLKLIKQLREQAGAAALSGAASGRQLRELTLEEPIRYAAGDPVERWLNDLLCLDCGDAVDVTGGGGCPHPDACELYYVNKDTLFSFHEASEEFLRRVMGLYVSSHYKNSPNDLLLMSDSPAHHIFVLLGPVSTETQGLPEVLCVLQVALEGEIAKEEAGASLLRGVRAAGDLIPWTLAQQYQEPAFAALSGARVVRVATHPAYQRMGYGRRALAQLTAYYEGRRTGLDTAPTLTDVERTPVEGGSLQEALAPRPNLPPLLLQLEERRAERLHYLGTSFGVTPGLFTFWKKAGFSPLYVRQTANETTGEHSCIMLRPLEAGQDELAANWLETFSADFQRRFLALLAAPLRSLPSVLALDILLTANAARGTGAAGPRQLSKEDLAHSLTQYDLRRLDAYSRNLVDYHLIMDLLPAVARLYFTGQLPGVSLSPVQATIMVALGLQCQTIDDVVEQLKLRNNQVLAMFNKAMRKLVQQLAAVEDQAIAESLQLPKRKAGTLPAATVESLEEELEGAAAEATKGLAQKQAAFLQQLNAPDLAVGGTDQEWQQQLGGNAPPEHVSIVRKHKRKREDAQEEAEKKKIKRHKKKKRKSRD